jgi:serine/threonine-protein kinase
MRLLLTFPIIGLLNLLAIPPVNIPPSLSAELLSQNHENSTQIVSRSTEVPMKLELAVEHEMYIMTVPNQDLSQSAYAGELSFYDVHIAKMFEITYNDCQEIQSRVPEGIKGRDWIYQQGNDDDSMTTEVFYITCNLASEIVETYGLGKAEETLVEAFVDHHPTRSIRTDLIPILDITGSKISQWQDFVDAFESR